jgi:hypothetical protein
MKQLSRLTLLLGITLLTGCLYDNPPSGPSRNIDTWLVGQWETKDKADHSVKVTVTPEILSTTPFAKSIDGMVASSTRYHITLSGLRGGDQEFEAWISRVDDFVILVVKSLNQGNSYGKYALYHYELLAPGTPPPGGIGATRIRLSELQLDDSCRSLDSYKLRAAIRHGLKDGTLLTAYDVAAVRKEEAKQNASAPIGADLSKPEVKSSNGQSDSSTSIEIPGSVIWTKTGGVTLHGETFSCPRTGE